MTTTTVILSNGVTMSVENILRVFREASANDVANGLAWYGDANHLASTLAGGDLETGAGVIAALSPRTPWGTNVSLAERAIREDGITFGTLGANMTAANRIIRGEDPDTVLSGPKVRAFFATIVDPTSPDAVVIDTHALSVAAGRVLTKNERRIVEKPGMYDLISALYREAASILGILPNQVQSVTWLTWRGKSRAEKA